MKKVKVKRAEVLARIEANYKKHVTDYEEAFTAYQAEVARVAGERRLDFDRELTALVKRVREADVKVDKPVPASLPSSLLNFGLVIPVSHAKDYVQVIEMLRMEVSDEIELESDQFACYVLDDWDWRESFESTNALYKSAGARR